MYQTLIDRVNVFESFNDLVNNFAGWNFMGLWYVICYSMPFYQETQIYMFIVDMVIAN